MSSYIGLPTTESSLAGGRSTPFMANYRPQLYIRTADVNVGLTWPEGVADADEKMVQFLY